jgi:hypothetical protein
MMHDASSFIGPLEFPEHIIRKYSLREGDRVTITHSGIEERSGRFIGAQDNNVVIQLDGSEIPFLFGPSDHFGSNVHPGRDIQRANPPTAAGSRFHQPRT